MKRHVSPQKVIDKIRSFLITFCMLGNQAYSPAKAFVLEKVLLPLSANVTIFVCKVTTVLIRVPGKSVLGL